MIFKVEFNPEPCSHNHKDANYKSNDPWHRIAKV
jgi:hypothetical protein